MKRRLEAALFFFDPQLQDTEVVIVDFPQEAEVIIVLNQGSRNSKQVIGGILPLGLATLSALHFQETLKYPLVVAQIGITVDLDILAHVVNTHFVFTSEGVNLHATVGFSNGTRLDFVTSVGDRETALPVRAIGIHYSHVFTVGDQNTDAFLEHRALIDFAPDINAEITRIITDCLVNGRQRDEDSVPIGDIAISVPAVSVGLIALCLSDDI